jgi:hypothetical protein
MDRRGFLRGFAAALVAAPCVPAEFIMENYLDPTRTPVSKFLQAFGSDGIAMDFTTNEAWIGGKLVKITDVLNYSGPVRMDDRGLWVGKGGRANIILAAANKRVPDHLLAALTT